MVETTYNGWNRKEPLVLPLVEQILQQSTTCSADVLSSQFAAKQQVINNRSQFLSDTYDLLLSSLPSKLQRSILLSSEEGSSSWLTALPLADQGFALHKGAFRDALCLRYGWQPQLLPSHCTCGKTMSIEHTLSCPFGGFPSIRHNELRDITAGFLCEVCHNVGILYNHCLGSSFITDQLTSRMVLAWMFVQRVSGAGIGGRLTLI